MNPLLAVGIITFIAVCIPLLILAWIKRAEERDTDKLISMINVALPAIKKAREKMERELREARK